MERAGGREDRREWRNWAGTATGTPAAVVSAAQPRRGSRRRSRRRPAPGCGAGAWQRALVHPGRRYRRGALDLSLWTGIVAADTRTGLVTVRSGTTLRALNAALDGLGLAMANLGDIDAQTLAGALAREHTAPAPGWGGWPPRWRRLSWFLPTDPWCPAPVRTGPGCSPPRGSALARSA